MFGSSPGLFAAYRVLRRLLAPRHPPYALNNLAIDARARYGVSKVQPDEERSSASLHPTSGQKNPPHRCSGGGALNGGRVDYLNEYPLGSGLQSGIPPSDDSGGI